MPTTLEAGERRTRIIRRDTNEDGAEIWLVCEEVGPPSGVAVEPEDEPWFPMDEPASDATPPVLEIETSALQGRWHTELSTFASRAAEYVEAGHPDVTLTPENAADFGLRPVDSSDRPPLRRWRAR